MSGLHFHLHGLSISFRTDDPDLRAFVGEYFDSEPVEASDAALEIHGAWNWGGGAAGRAAEGLPPGAERLGRGLMLSNGETGALRARWSRVPDFPELTLQFELSDGVPLHLKVLADCSYSPKGVGRKLRYMRRASLDRKRNRLFFKLMYFMVYYPLAWYLERTRGWGLVHASAVTLESGKAVLLSGLGGVGKSTLGLGLLARTGARLLSDNLIFHDQDRVYSCPEPVRLDASALQGMEAEAVKPERTALPLSAHPKPTYRVGPERLTPEAEPQALYFLRFASRSGMDPIDPLRAAEMLGATNDLAREIKDYRPFSALLTMLAAERGMIPLARRARLDRLLDPVRCFIFRIGEGEKISETLARLADRVAALA